MSAFLLVAVVGWAGFSLREMVERWLAAVRQRGWEAPAGVMLPYRFGGTFCACRGDFVALAAHWPLSALSFAPRCL
jgi:hypothetical protein